MPSAVLPRGARGEGRTWAAGRRTGPPPRPNPTHIYASMRVRECHCCHHRHFPAATAVPRGAKQRGDSMQQDTQNDRNRRRCGGHATEQWSERGGGREGKGEQGGANKKSRRTAMTNAPLGAHTHTPGRGGGGVQQDQDVLSLPRCQAPQDKQVNRHRGRTWTRRGVLAAQDVYTL
jgi:hypothetical protein